MSIEQRHFPQFYLTPEGICPYLPGKSERKVFTHLIGKDAAKLNDQLTHGGFRRSQNIAYRPACDHCQACTSVRVLVDEFAPAKSFRRTISRNSDMVGQLCEARATPEQYSLFRDYIESRHGDGGMADMSVLDYASMIEDSFVDTRMVEYRVRPEVSLAGPDARRGTLIAAALTDILSDGLSMIYSFFNPDEAARSLGTYMILEHIERARKMGLPYLYLGYWVRGSEKMDYKQRFRPLEMLAADGWTRD
ncbi:MAG: arginyltransferase [Hyphomicrobiales bacterium]